MRWPIAAPWCLVAVALSAAVAPDPAPAQEAIRISDKAITPLPVRAPFETAEAKFTDVAVHLIGAPGDNTLRVSARATVAPKLDLSGKEKAVLYFYNTCDDEPPARSIGAVVASLVLGDLPAGRAAQTIIMTGTATSLVPLSSVACAKLAILCKECGEAPPPPIRISDKAVTSLPVRAPFETAEATFTDVAVHLIGAPGDTTLSVSAHATVVPKLDLSGKEKAVLYFYNTCDDEPPARSIGAVVATLELGDLPAGWAARTIIMTGTATSLVPLSSVACVKLAILCKECGEAPVPPPAAATIRRLDLVLDSDVDDFRLDAPSLTLVGEPASKSFGVAFSGTVLPTVDLTGEEKAVIRLYTDCAGDQPPGADATNVATVELRGLRKGNDRQRLTATKDATAFVPMQDIGCAVVDME